jgi:hypothetical protein
MLRERWNNMNSKAIHEIGDIIRIRNSWAWKLPFFNRKLSPEEIMDSYEYKAFKESCPELCRLAEKGEL